MIRAAVGLSREPGSARAALAAARELLGRIDGEGDAVDWAIAFVTPEHLEHLSAIQDALSGALGTPYVVGCSAAGVLAGDTEIEQGPGLTVLGVRSDQLRATPFLFHDEGDQGMTAGVRLGQRMLGSRDSADLLLAWPDAFRVRPDRLLQGLDAVLRDVPVLGGASSSRDADQDTLQFCGAEISSGAVAGLRLAGGFRHVVGITQGCRPLGDPLRVTRAHDNLILELEGRPALDVLRERAPKGLMEDPERAFHFLFVGLVPEGPRSPSWTGEYLIRNVVAHDPDTGVLAIADHVEEGQHLLFAHREANSARADLSRLAESVAPERTGLRYRFGLYFNCLARGQSLYGEPGVDAATLSRALPGVPLAGFFCGAELAPLGGSNQLFTYTGVLLLVAE